MAIKVVTFETSTNSIMLNDPIEVVHPFPVGAIFITVDPTNPATSLGYGSWIAFATGRVLIGLDASNPSFDTIEETGGALTIPAAGSVSAPTFTGSSATTGAVSAGTPSGSVAAPVFTGTPGTVPAQAISWPVGVPTFAGTPFSLVINHVHAVNITDPGHTHTIQMQGSATPATTGVHIVNSTATGGSSRVATAPDQANSNTSGVTATTSNPAGGVANITPAGAIAWPAGVPVNSTVSFTPAGTNSAPTFSGNALATHTHTLAATGTISAPIFTGAPTSVVQPYIVVYMWKRIA